MKKKRPSKPRIIPLEEVRKAAILAAIEEVAGNVTLAAEQLEMGKTTLYRKLKKYGIIVEQYRVRRRSRLELTRS